MPAKTKLKSPEIHALFTERFADQVVEENTKNRDAFLVIRPERWREIAVFLRDDERLAFDLLSCISGVDYLDRGQIEVVYCLDSTVHNHWLILKICVPREDPAVPSVERVWLTADWHERETFDLLGVRFVGHHNLTRILCAEDWEGHPLRKDYVIPDVYHGIKNVIY